MEEMVEVRIINFDVKGQYLVIEVANPANAYLVDKGFLEFSYGVQNVEKEVLDFSERPYDFTQELNQYAYTYDQMRLAFWRRGMVDADPNIDKHFLATLFRSGVLPIVKE